MELNCIAGLPVDLTDSLEKILAGLHSLNYNANHCNQSSGLVAVATVGIFGVQNEFMYRPTQIWCWLFKFLNWLCVTF